MSSLYTILFLIPFLGWLGVRVGICTRDFPGGPAAAAWVKPVLWTLVVGGLLVPQALPGFPDNLRNGIWCLACGLGGAEIVAGSRLFGRFMADQRAARAAAAAVDGGEAMSDPQRRSNGGGEGREGSRRRRESGKSRSDRSGREGRDSSRTRRH